MNENPEARELQDVADRVRDSQPHLAAWLDHAAAEVYGSRYWRGSEHPALAFVRSGER